MNSNFLLIICLLTAVKLPSSESVFFPRSNHFVHGKSMSRVFPKDITSVSRSTIPTIDIAGGSNRAPNSLAPDSDLAENGVTGASAGTNLVEVESGTSIVEINAGTDIVEVNPGTLTGKDDDNGSDYLKAKPEFPTDIAALNGTGMTKGIDRDSPSRRSTKKRLFRRKKKIKSAASIGKRLKNRNSMNIKRKLIHVGFGAMFASLNHALPRKHFLPFMYLVNTVSIFVETFRYRKGFELLNKIMHGILGSTLRKHEMEGKFTGSLYYFSGVTTSALLFPKTAATLGIFQLALADPAASYFGRRTRHVYWSRIENGFFGIGRNKGILGFVGGALVCFPFNYRVLSVAKWGVNSPLAGKGKIIFASIALGAAGSFADLAVPTPAVTLPSKYFPLSIDDNFVVPVLSGFACMKIFDHLRWSHDLELAKYIIF